MSLHQPSQDDMNELGELLGRMFAPNIKLTEQEEFLQELGQLISNSFKSDEALHRMADISQGNEEQDVADVFASSCLAELMNQGLVPPQMPRVLFLYMKGIMAHWFRIHDQYTRQGEI